ncbi:hypothetical protein JTB14_027277 [Gonioctena quinquepunctata]|nr:hypothetical protein JTB14_027277 [Gonioctena quinquepunctata]
MIHRGGMRFEKIINIVSEQLEDSKILQDIWKIILLAPENNVTELEDYDGTLRIVELRLLIMYTNYFYDKSRFGKNGERILRPNAFSEYDYLEKMQNRCQHSMDIMTFEVTRILKQKYNDPSRRDEDLKRMINIVREQLEDSKYFTKYMEDNFIALVKAAEQKVCQNISLAPVNNETGSLKIIDGTVENSRAAIADHVHEFISRINHDSEKMVNVFLDQMLSQNMTYLEKMQNRCQHMNDIMTFEVTRILKQKYNDPSRRDEDLKK